MVDIENYILHLCVCASRPSQGPARVQQGSSKGPARAQQGSRAATKKAHERFSGYKEFVYSMVKAT